MASPNRVSFDNEGGIFRSVRRAVLVVVGLIVFALFLSATVTRIDAAHVGIRVRLAGSARGVQDIPIVKRMLDKYAPQSQPAKEKDVP